MSLYVTVEPRTLKEAEERAEADASSSIVSVTRVSAEEVRRREWWAAVDAQQRHHHARAAPALRGIDGGKRGIA